MKINDIVVGERYEVSIDWISSRYSGVTNGRYEAEVVELRVHRKVRRDGYIAESRRPDGVAVEILMDGEAFPDNIVHISPANVLRPWQEKLDEDAIKYEAERKKERHRAVERMRGQKYNERVTQIIGKVPDRGTVDHRRERVELRTPEWDIRKPTHGTLWFESIDELARIVDLMEKGLEHEKLCSQKDS